MNQKLGTILPIEKDLVRNLCPYDLDSCVPCTYYHVYGCPCRGETEESEAIILKHRSESQGRYPMENEEVKELAEIIKESPCWNRAQTNIPRYINEYLSDLCKKITQAGFHRSVPNDKLREKILKQALEDDATGLWEVTNAIKKEIESRKWILDGRGSYAWNDRRYKDETRFAFEAVLKLISEVQKPSSNRFHQVLKDLALLPSRPSPPENRVEAIKKIVDEILVEESLIALNFDKKKIEDAKNWSALQVEANYKLREKAISSLASLTPELTLISDEEINEVISGLNYISSFAIGKRIAQAQLDHDKQIGR